jgi:hypothetical protein
MFKTGVLIKRAMRIWQRETCIRFIEKKSFSGPGITVKGSENR